MIEEYRAFVASKSVRFDCHGEDADISDRLYPFQQAVAHFAVKKGRAGVFLGTGLGKSAIQIEFAHHAAEYTNGRSLILAPLAVAAQFRREAAKFGREVTVIREQSQARDGINVCNYDRIDKIDPDAFGGVCLDEGSILKQFGGATQRRLTDAFAGHRFRMSATATPAPNDWMELGTQCDFLGVMSTKEMLSRWFINDTKTASQNWRLKGHAAADFWSWVSSWARIASTPSDLGFPDDGFVLEPYVIHRHTSRACLLKAKPGELFATAESATTIFDAKRQTADERCSIAADVVSREPTEPWIVWCDTNQESEIMAKSVPGSVEVTGSLSVDEKEARIEAFLSGDALVLVTKPGICGFGLNFQHCARAVFVGRTFSFESWYQAVRRIHRHGQKRQVHIHLVIADGERQTDAAIEKKEAAHNAMVEAMRRATSSKRSSRLVMYEPRQHVGIPKCIALS